MANFILGIGVVAWREKKWKTVATGSTVRKNNNSHFSYQTSINSEGEGKKAQSVQKTLFLKEPVPIGKSLALVSFLGGAE